MASNINPNNINTAYPIAGQINDTQGFRDNFTNISNNFTTAATEITNLQIALNTTNFAVNTSINTISISTETITLANVIQLANLTQTQIAAISSPVNGQMAYNYTYGNVVAYTSYLGRWGNVVVS